MSDPQDLKKSPLDGEHRRLGGRLVPFAGWEMPVQYEGIVDEHRAVRAGVGIFDISHMGEYFVDGPGAGSWLDGLLTNAVRRLDPGCGQYTLLCNSQGGVIDDLILYRRPAPDAGYFLVVNAAKVSEDAAWLRAHHPPADVRFVDASDAFAAMAVQGPESAAVYQRVRAATATDGAEAEASPQSPGATTLLPDLPDRNGLVESHGCLVCRTGYTGEDGFEFFCPVAEAATWWRRFVEAGARPCGLGARDSLRLEMGYPLNDVDLTPDHTPLEAGLGVFVDLNKDFVGSDALREQKASGVTRRLVMFRMVEACPPPRSHYRVLHDGEDVGCVTSGGLSLTPGTAARWGGGMVYLPAALARPGTPLEVVIRSRGYRAMVVKKPIYRNGGESLIPPPSQP